MTKQKTKSTMMLHEISGVPEEFMNLVKSFCTVERNPFYKKYGYYSRNKEQGKEVIPSIMKYWCIGGVTGGNCWGDEANEPVTAENEPDFGGLDDFLLEVYPTTTFLQYKKILSCEKEYEYTHNEYYGNHTEYKVKYITIKDLYEILREFGYDQ